MTTPIQESTRALAPVWSGHMAIPGNREMSLNFLMARSKTDIKQYCHVSYVLCPVSQPLNANCEKSAYSELVAVLGSHFYNQTVCYLVQNGTTLAPEFKTETMVPTGVTIVGSVKRLEGKSAEYLLGQRVGQGSLYTAWRRGENQKAVTFVQNGGIAKAQFVFLGLIGQLYYEYNHDL